MSKELLMRAAERAGKKAMLYLELVALGGTELEITLASKYANQRHLFLGAIKK